MTIIVTFIDVIDIPSGGRAFSFDFDLHDSAIEGSFFQHGCFDNMFSAGVGKNKSHHRLKTISRGFIISKIARSLLKCMSSDQLNTMTWSMQLVTNNLPTLRMTRSH